MLAWTTPHKMGLKSALWCELRTPCLPFLTPNIQYALAEGLLAFVCVQVSIAALHRGTDCRGHLQFAVLGFTFMQAASLGIARYLTMELARVSKAHKPLFKLFKVIKVRLVSRLRVCEDVFALTCVWCRVPG